LYKCFTTVKLAYWDKALPSPLAQPWRRQLPAKGKDLQSVCDNRIVEHKEPSESRYISREIDNHPHPYSSYLLPLTVGSWANSPTLYGTATKNALFVAVKGTHSEDRKPGCPVTRFVSTTIRGAFAKVPPTSPLNITSTATPMQEPLIVHTYVFTPLVICSFKCIEI